MSGTLGLPSPPVAVTVATAAPVRRLVRDDHRARGDGRARDDGSAVAPDTGAVHASGAEDRDEQQLLLAAADGDREAFATLYDRLGAIVHTVVVRVVRDRAMSEEVVQEVFVELWRTAPRYDPHRGSARTWTLTLAHRRAVDRVRSEQSRRDRTWRVGTEDHRVAYDEVAEQVEDRIDRDRAIRALESLTDLQRESIEMAYLGGRTYREVAAELDVPLGTVKSRMRDGLHALRAALGVTR